MQAVFIVLGQKKASWKDFQNAARNPVQLLERMAKVDPTRLTRGQFTSLKEITSHSEFNRDMVKAKSMEAATICDWVLEVEKLALEAGVRPYQSKQVDEFSPYEKIVALEETKEEGPINREEL